MAEANRVSDLTKEMKAELDRRVADMEANPERGVPWELVKAETLKRARK